MSRDPLTFRRVERVGHLYDVLQSCEHDCFPVLNAEEGGVLVGTVLRKALCVILQVGFCWFAFGGVALADRPTDRSMTMISFSLLTYIAHPYESTRSTRPSPTRTPRGPRRWRAARGRGGAFLVGFDVMLWCALVCWLR